MFNQNAGQIQNANQNTNQSHDRKTGVLYIISTPIGNLEDITFRALRTLKEVDLIAAEDTRQTQKLLYHYEIRKSLISYHSYNKIKNAYKIIKQLKAGANVGLVSDAGTPGISDPAYHLVRSCIEEKIGVIPIPGPTALIPALVISGLKTARFVFEGFLPIKKGKKMNRLKEMESEERTIIIYESARRLLETLKNIYEIFGEREIAIVRELTKIYEETIRGNLSDILNKSNEITLRGEIVLVIEGKVEKKKKDQDEQYESRDMN